MKSKILNTHLETLFSMDDVEREFELGDSMISFYAVRCYFVALDEIRLLSKQITRIKSNYPGICFVASLLFFLLGLGIGLSQ